MVDNMKWNDLRNPKFEKGYMKNGSHILVLQDLLAWNLGSKGKTRGTGAKGRSDQYTRVDNRHAHHDDAYPSLEIFLDNPHSLLNTVSPDLMKSTEIEPNTQKQLKQALPFVRVVASKYRQVFLPSETETRNLFATPISV